MLSTLVQLQLTGTSCNADQGSPERARDFACHSVSMYAIASQRLQLQLWHCKCPVMVWVTRAWRMEGYSLWTRSDQIVSHHTRLIRCLTLNGWVHLMQARIDKTKGLSHSQCFAG